MLVTLFRNYGISSVALSVLLLAMGLSINASAQPTSDPAELVEVADAAWTSAVTNLQFTDRYENGSTIARTPVYLWMRLKATRRALEQLQRDHRLPIRHNWIRYSGTRVDLDREELTDAISLGVGTADLVPQLERELAGRGYFDWRTWSMKSNIRSGGWEVDIVYNDGSPVLCPGRAGTTMTRCRYYVWIS